MIMYLYAVRIVLIARRVWVYVDMVKERDYLMESAYPELKEFCRQRFGLEFQVHVNVC